MREGKIEVLRGVGWDDGRETVFLIWHSSLEGKELLVPLKGYSMLGYRGLQGAHCVHRARRVFDVITIMVGFFLSNKNCNKIEKSLVRWSQASHA